MIKKIWLEVIEISWGQTAVSIYTNLMNLL